MDSVEPLIYRKNVKQQTNENTVKMAFIVQMHVYA